jgi:hypothetical protein
MLTTALHPFDPAFAAAFVAAASDPAASDLLPGVPPARSASLVADARTALARLAAGDDRGARDFTATFAHALAELQPVFLHESLTLTAWEARIDRGAAMLLRPPARLFVEAGLPARLGHRLPVRLDSGGASMGGAWVPPHLVPQFAALLDTRFDRIAQRLAESDLDPLGVIAMSQAALAYAAAHNLGLFESDGVVLADAPAGASLRLYDRKRVDPALRQRVAVAVAPAKAPGLLSRLTRRHPATDAPSPNGKHEG